MCPKALGWEKDSQARRETVPVPWTVRDCDSPFSSTSWWGDLSTTGPGKATSTSAQLLASINPPKGSVQGMQYQPHWCFLSSRPLSLPVGSGPHLRASSTLILHTCINIYYICYLSVHVCAQLLRHVRRFAAPWTVARQAPVPVGFSRQEYWSGLPSPPPGDLPNPGIEPTSVVPPALTD